MLFAIVAGVAAGWISAVSMIGNYAFEAAAGQPQWKERRNATDHPAAPYAFGYFINQGQVPPPLTSRHFVRSTDDEGHQLRNECLYELSGMMPAPRKSGILPGHLAQDAFPADDFFHADALAAARADGAGDVVLLIAHVPFFA